ncbi:MAG: hypothetical protein OXC72_01010 [Roseovarius sp.]|nr:hypothetical protein [Roseovarius sp.]MCY4317082.1 hypothetical protein [Roseovarius sp.]
MVDVEQEPRNNFNKCTMGIADKVSSGLRWLQALLEMTGMFRFKHKLMDHQERKHVLSVEHLIRAIELISPESPGR